MQLQISININRINRIIYIICVFSPPFCLEALSRSFFMTSFTSRLVTPLVRNVASKLNNWDSSQE